MSLNQPATNLEKARIAWGPDLPRWVHLLATACDRASQRAVADRIAASGFRCNNATVSKLINRAYPASYAEPERAVLAVYSGDKVLCPVFNVETPLSACIRNRRRKPEHRQSWLHHEYAQACPDCPNNTDAPAADDDGDLA